MYTMRVCLYVSSIYVCNVLRMPIYLLTNVTLVMNPVSFNKDYVYY